MSDSFKGCILGLLSAITYGMNPLFGIHLYREGMTPPSVLFYRFSFATVMLGILLFVQRKSFRLPRRYHLYAIAGGCCLALSCLFWFFSFSVMDSGIAATMLYTYPIIVAVVMTAGFHERFTLSTGLGMFFAVVGVAILSLPATGVHVNALGTTYALVAALFYALYLVGVRVSRLSELPSDLLTFYSLLFGSVVFLLQLRGGMSLQMLPSWAAFGNALGLAFFPSMLSFLLMAMAIHYIGATKTAILGALEPASAVCIGIWVFSECFTWRLGLGMFLILASVIIEICGRSKIESSKEHPAPLSEQVPEQISEK